MARQTEDDPEHDGRSLSVRKARRLEYFTLAWNAAEAMVAIAAGSAAGSVALIGFGVDSVIESLSGAALLWRLRSHSHGEVRERRALRMVGWAFVALAVYVGAESGLAIARREPPAASLAGTALAAASVVVMPVLARAKRRVARRMGSAALAADARQTDLCAYLSVILLGGLALNALFGLWWADPVAGLAMVPVIAVEGLSALRGRTCSGC